MTVIFKALVDLSHDERAAIWMIRYFAGPGRPCCRVGTGLSSGLFLKKDLDALGAAFRNALDRCSGLGAQLPDVRTRGSDQVSLSEMILLDAAAFAQSGDERRMHRALRRIFVQHHVIASFAAVMTQLSACLASAGYWLLARLPASAGGVARKADSLSHGDEGRAERPQGRRKAVPPVAAASLATLSRWRPCEPTRQVLWPASYGHP